MTRRRRDESVGVGEAKSHFSELVERVRSESLTITITRHGQPVARLVPLDLVPAPAHLADARGWLDDDDPFFDALSEIESRRHAERPRRLALED